MRGLNKPIQEANYKSKNKKIYTIKRQIFLNSAPVAIMYERVPPLMDEEKKRKK